MYDVGEIKKFCPSKKYPLIPPIVYIMNAAFVSDEIVSNCVASDFGRFLTVNQVVCFLLKIVGVQKDANFTILSATLLTGLTVKCYESFANQHLHCF